MAGLIKPNTSGRPSSFIWSYNCLSKAKSLQKYNTIIPKEISCSVCLPHISNDTSYCKFSHWSKAGKILFGKKYIEVVTKCIIF